MNEIQKYRQRNKLTQAQLAEKLGVSISTIKNWENGRRNISKSRELLMKYLERSK